jgi:hypothetical protein
MRKLGLAAVAAVVATPLMAASAWASACVTGTVASYETAGFSCTVDNGAITFSNFAVNTIGNVTLGNFTPFVDSTNTEFGLSLNYAATTTAMQPNADVAWTYNVSGNLISDAYAAFSGGVTGTGTQDLTETLSNSGDGFSATLTLNAPGSQTIAINPAQSSLTAMKDQDNFAGSAGSATASIVTNGFSLTATPIPGALPLFATGLVGFWGLRKKRGKQSAAAQAA